MKKIILTVAIVASQMLFSQTQTSTKHSEACRELVEDLVEHAEISETQAEKVTTLLAKIDDIFFGEESEEEEEVDEESADYIKVLATFENTLSQNISKILTKEQMTVYNDKIIDRYEAKLNAK